MFGVSGPISDRIRSGDIPADAFPTTRPATEEEQPTTAALHRAEGHGLGRGATTARNGGN